MGPGDSAFPRFRLGERGGPRGVKSDISFDFLQDLVNVAIEDTD